LTNYSINKHNAEFQEAENEDDDNASKWTLLKWKN